MKEKYAGYAMALKNEGLQTQRTCSICGCIHPDCTLDTYQTSWRLQPVAVSAISTRIEHTVIYSHCASCYLNNRGKETC